MRHTLVQPVYLPLAASVGSHLLTATVDRPRRLTNAAVLRSNSLRALEAQGTADRNLLPVSTRLPGHPWPLDQMAAISIVAKFVAAFNAAHDHLM